jgi:hypothetical protein
VIAGSPAALLLIIILILIPWGPDVSLPDSDYSHLVPSTPVVVEVTGDGAATFRGKSFPGLQWPIPYHEGWLWLRNTPYWKELFEPNEEYRTKEKLYGWDVPILLTLDRNLKFAAPPFDGQTNIWVRTESEDASRPRGVSFCFVDPLDPLDENRGRIWLYWQGGRVEMPFTKGCIPVAIEKDGFFSILIGVAAIWLPKPDDKKVRCVLMPNLYKLPSRQISTGLLRNYLRAIGPGTLLCVKVEEEATVQDVVNFMSLCEEMEQPWTFHFDAVEIE